jgi:hypothetical protein
MIFSNPRLALDGNELLVCEAGIMAIMEDWQSRARRGRLNNRSQCSSQPPRW